MNNYILDTSVILNNPYSIYNFGDGNVITPLTTLGELDKKKTQPGDVGVNAREFFRQYLKLRTLEKDENGSIPLKSGGTFRIELNHTHTDSIRSIFGELDNDRKILSVAVNLALESYKEGTRDKINNDTYTLVSADYGFIAEADAAKEKLKLDNLTILYYSKDSNVATNDNLYTGNRDLSVPQEVMLDLRKHKKLPLELFKSKVNLEDQEELNIGEFITCVNEYNEKDVFFTRIVEENGELMLRKLIEYDAMETKGVKARDNNKEQKMLMDLLMDKKTELITIVGKAGSGKTLLTLASAIAQIERDNSYRKLLVARPMISMGKDPGAFPGDVDEKVRPWMRSVFDNLEIIAQANSGNSVDPSERESIIDEYGFMEVGMLQLIRGRTLPDHFIFIDEAQNLTIHEARTIITRAGEGSKIVLAGDPDQIDHPYLDSTNNGLVYVQERMKGADLFGAITLVKSERSRLTEIATERLK